MNLLNTAIFLAIILLFTSCGGSQPEENTKFQKELTELLTAKRKAADAFCACMESKSEDCTELANNYDYANSEFSAKWNSKEDLFEVLGQESRKTMYNEDNTISLKVNKARNN